MVSRSIVNRNRLIRSRGTGIAVIAIMGFLIAGFVFQPVVSQIPFVAPNIEDLQIELPDISDPLGTCQELAFQFMQENPNAILQGIEPCQEESIDDIIDFLENEPNFEEPISSDDPPLKQIGDLINSTEIVDAILPQSDKIGLIVEIATIDSSGTRSVKEFTQAFTPLAFFGDPSIGLDLSGGSLEFRMWVETDPDTSVTGTGSYTLNLIHHRDLNLPQDKIDQSGLVTVSGVADQNGLVTIEFVDITGQKTNVFTFDFTQENIDLFFPLNSKGLINFNIQNLMVQKDFREDFEIAEAEIFSISLLNAEDAVIFENVDGTKEVLLPSDNKLTISSTSNIRVDCTGVSSGICPLRGLPQPAVGAIKVTDSNGLVIAGSQLFMGLPLLDSNGRLYFQPATVLVDTNLVRGEIYTVDISEPTTITFEVFSPVSQANFDYSCKLTGVSSNELRYGSLGQEDAPIICNFPFNNTETITFEDGGGEFSVGIRG